MKNIFCQNLYNSKNKIINLKNLSKKKIFIKNQIISPEKKRNKTNIIKNNAISIEHSRPKKKCDNGGILNVLKRNSVGKLSKYLITDINKRKKK